MSQKRKAEIRVLSKSGKRQKDALILNYGEVLDELIGLCELLEKIEANKDCIPLPVRENLKFCIEIGNCSDINLEGLNAIAEDLKEEIKSLKVKIIQELDNSGNGYELKKDLGVRLKK
ncbi:MAG: hypothetical protein ACOC1P_01380 [Minisyncoccales bacterium]